MAKIKVELSQKSIERAIAEIESYKVNLQSKISVFLDKIADCGIKVVRATMASVPNDQKGSYWTEQINKPPNGVAILLGGNKVLFVEFGAGVIYSNPQSPKAKANGMDYGVGTYPDQKYAWNMTKWGGGWWYTDNSGESVHSLGNPAYMPMYKAEVEILAQVRNIAKDVFRGR